MSDLPSQSMLIGDLLHHQVFKIIEWLTIEAIICVREVCIVCPEPMEEVKSERDCSDCRSEVERKISLTIYCIIHGLMNKRPQSCMVLKVSAPMMSTTDLCGIPSEYQSDHI